MRPVLGSILQLVSSTVTACPCDPGGDPDVVLRRSIEGRRVEKNAVSIDRPIVVWFRQDLRIADQPALAAAAAGDRPVAPLFVLDDLTAGCWKVGGASRWWLHGSLEALGASLGGLGARLVLRRGASTDVVANFACEISASGVYCTRHVEPCWRAADCELEGRLEREHIDFRRFPGTTLFEPGSVVGRDGRPLRVFTPFYKACLAAAPPASPVPAPRRLRPLASEPASERLEEWELRPKTPDWAGGLREAWRLGEASAGERLAAFCTGELGRYHRDRDRPEPAATSRLSPHLHFGEISARTVWDAVASNAGHERQVSPGAEDYLRELCWREFYSDIIARNPHVADEPLQKRFAAFPWRDDPAGLRAWQRGCTGYPLVDAGMRQLWRTGWMHNRVRMITASFLIKHLLIPWQTGEAWFWDTLIDADLGNNAGGWQWVAGCGTDAAPYFRIFNPVMQGERFDPAGAYVRRWVPELARLPDRFIHRPWQASPVELAAAGVRRGIDYPSPIVDHAEARRRALGAFARMSAGN